MTNMRSAILSSIALGTALSAQAFTSPAGYVTTEGSSNHDYILFRYSDLRWQQLDATSIGQAPTPIQRISWRRDGVAAANTAWAARTLDVGVHLSNAVTPGAISESFDANYSGTPVLAFASRPVNLPDWTQPPAAAPAPFDFNLQLDAPWVYMGTEPFLWEVRVTNNVTATNYGNDFQSIPGSTGSSNTGTAVGTGCVATGRTAAMALACSAKNQFTRFRLGYGLTNAPASTPAILFIDGTNSNLTIPGLCSTLVALPTLQLPMGNTDAAGALSTFSIENIPFQQSTVGVTLFSQAVAVDVGQAGLPIAVSNGRSNVFPATPATPCLVTRVYEYRLSATSMRAPSVWTGGIVAQFD